MANNNLLASDNFVSGSLAAGWAAGFGNLKCQVIVGSPNVTEPNALSTVADQIWTTGLTFPNGQTSELTINALTAEVGTQIRIMVRWQSGVYSGYIAILENSTAKVYRFDAGAPTQLSTTVSGLTIASGDVWALQAAASGINLYQNGKRIFWWYDTTYTSGAPGYGQYSTVNIAHTRVSAWRGYNLLQQDGIWAKQDITIPALVGDLAVGVFIPTQVLYEGGAQILSGTVYKIWFGAGYPTSQQGSGNIYYAESLDGINWTRRVNPVIANQLGPAIIKVGGTYYMFTQSSTAFATGDFQVSTSTDGINWTLQNAHVLSLGTAGTWDSVKIFTFAPIAIINGTWWAAYGGTKFASGPKNSQGSTGLATSTDGINWVKYVGNPVLLGWPTQAFYKVGSLWYAWVQQTQLGQGATFPGGDPTDSVRYSSPDLITWSNPIHSVHHSQMFESVNAPTGQCFINSIINIGGKAYAYTNSEPADGDSPQVYQIGLAIGPTTIENIVTQNEDAAPQIASDTFPTPGDLSVSWVTPTGSTKLTVASAGVVEPSVINTHCGMYHTGTFTADQYSEITIGGSLNVNGDFYPTVRVQPGAQSWYEAAIQANGSLGGIGIYKMVAGTETLIGTLVQLTPLIGDVWRLQVTTGSDGFPVLSLFQNGFLVIQVQDYANTFTTGNPGMAQFAAVAITNSKITAWAGGNAGVIPTYPSDVSGNTGVAGAKVSYSGTASGSVTADGSGNFLIPSLAAGSYTITPSLTAHQFSPTSRAVVVTGSGAAITGVNFTTRILSGGTSFDFRFRF